MDIEAVKNTLTHNAAGDIELGVRGPSPPLGANRMDIEDETTQETPLTHDAAGDVELGAVGPAPALGANPGSRVSEPLERAAAGHGWLWLGRLGDLLLELLARSLGLALGTYIGWQLGCWHHCRGY